MIMRFVLFFALSFVITACTSTSLLSPDTKGGEKSTTNQFQSVNDVRRHYGLNTLERDPVLERIAKEQSRLMAKHLKMTHNTEAGQRFSQRLKRSGYKKLAAENLAEGYKTKGEAFDAWVRSPPHRKNMLNKRMKRYGLGVVETQHPSRGKRKYWTLVLGG